MEDSTSSDLFWIETSTANASSDWSKRRRQVLQKVALKRRREPKQHHPNSRQLPVFIRDDDAGKSSESQCFDKGRHVQSENPDSTAIKPDVLPSHTSLTQLRVAAMHPPMLVQSNLDFVDLSSLASLEVGRYTGQRLIERPEASRISCEERLGHIVAMYLFIMPRASLYAMLRIAWLHE
jgi:hypothetical protein